MGKSKNKVVHPAMGKGKNNVVFYSQGHIGTIAQLCHLLSQFQCGMKVVLGIGLKNQNRLIGNSEQSIIDYNRFSACFVRKTEYSFLPNIITVVFR